MTPEPGQVWQFEDRRTGWRFLAVMLRRRKPKGNLVYNCAFDAFVLDWDNDYEHSHIEMIVTEYDLHANWKRVA